MGNGGRVVDPCMIVREDSSCHEDDPTNVCHGYVVTKVPNRQKNLCTHSTQFIKPDAHGERGNELAIAHQTRSFHSVSYALANCAQ
eukprot:SAG31_NODE_3014_length_4786_cov_9.641135_5_plen_86_part_00